MRRVGSMEWNGLSVGAFAQAEACGSGRGGCPILRSWRGVGDGGKVMGKEYRMITEAMRGSSDVYVECVTSRSPSVPHPLLRNEWGTHSVPGTISFVDWTPGNTFVGGVDANYGFHAVAFDSDGGSADYPDIFLGTRWEADLFFENVVSNEQTEGGLGGVLPRILDLTPVAVKGTFASNPDTDVYETSAAESFVPVGFQEITVSVVFNPPVPACTKVRLIVDEKINGTWIEKADVPREPPTEIALQFDEVNADQLRFTVIGTGCGPLDPYYLEVLARTDPLSP